MDAETTQMQEINIKGLQSSAILPPHKYKLKTENEIIKNWRTYDSPVVSICCSTFNHEEYIENAICSFLYQETNFPFEIIIRDDASTDRTSDIVRSFANRYPKIIRAVVNPINQFSLGVRAIHDWPALARGKYIALCEGDDFWISPFKLKKQLEMLEKSPIAVMAVAGTYACEQSGNELRIVQTYGDNITGLLGFDDIHKLYFHTSTYLLRTELLSEVVEQYFSGHTLFGDTALRAILISYGPFVALPEIVSVYRITGIGIWSSLDREKQLIWEFDTAKKLAEMLMGRHSKWQKRRFFGLQFALLKLYLNRARYKDVVMLLPKVIWYGVIKVCSGQWK